MSDKPGKDFVWQTVSVESFSEDPLSNEANTKLSDSASKRKSSMKHAVRNWHVGPGKYRVIYQTKPGKPWRGNC